MSQSHSSGPSARSSLSPAPLPDDQLAFRLREHVQKLKQIVPVLTVSILALRRQNAELDEDVATVLDQYASAPLDVLVDDLELFLESVVASRAVTRRDAA